MTEELVHVSELGTQRHLVLSRRLRARRRELGLTQKEVVARLRGLGVTTTNKALSSLEHGAGLDVAKLPELACALQCTLTYLVGLTDDPQRWAPDREHWPDPPPRRHQQRPSPTRTGPPRPVPVHRGHVDGRPGGCGPPILGPLQDE